MNHESLFSNPLLPCGYFGADYECHKILNCLPDKVCVSNPVPTNCKTISFGSDEMCF